MRFQFLAITYITWMALSYGPIGLAEVGEKTENAPIILLMHLRNSSCVLDGTPFVLHPTTA
jgi:hypothetical protein